MLPVHTSWTMFNQSFHEWFSKDVPTEIGQKKGAFLKSLTSFKPSEVKTALGDYVRIHLWNYVHRIQDGIWDPRGTGVAEDADADAASASNPQDATKVNAQKIFVDSWKRFLANARLKLQSASLPSTTTPAAGTNSGVHAGSVLGATSTSPGSSAVGSLGSRMMRARPSETPGHPGKPWMDSPPASRSACTSRRHCHVDGSDGEP